MKTNLFTVSDQNEAGCPSLSPVAADPITIGTRKRWNGGPGMNPELGRLMALHDMQDKTFIVPLKRPESHDGICKGHQS
jgi:hypothetical protein